MLDATNSISRDDLRATVEQSSAVVVDALPPAQFAIRRLPGAINVAAEHSDDQIRAALPDHDATIVTYATDDHCTRGTELAGRLRALGYRNVRSYQAGIEDWIAAGLPVDTAHAGDNAGPRGADANSSETPPPVRLAALPDGPYQITGPVHLTQPDGAASPMPDPVYLCRCGHSRTKPFCDGSHARTGWKDDE